MTNEEIELIAHKVADILEQRFKDSYKKSMCLPYDVSFRLDGIGMPSEKIDADQIKILEEFKDIPVTGTTTISY